MSYTTIQVSKETYDILHRLQRALKKILRKKSISMDVLIRTLIFIKWDLNGLLIEIENFLEGSEHERSQKAGILMSEEERQSLKKRRRT